MHAPHHRCRRRHTHTCRNTHAHKILQFLLNHSYKHSNMSTVKFCCWYTDWVRWCVYTPVQWVCAVQRCRTWRQLWSPSWPWSARRTCQWRKPNGIWVSVLTSVLVFYVCQNCSTQVVVFFPHTWSWLQPAMSLFLVQYLYIVVLRSVCLMSSLPLATCVSGIRSQSKPQDIMHEVFRAMKQLGYVSSGATCSTAS